MLAHKTIQTDPGGRRARIAACLLVLTAALAVSACGTTQRGGVSATATPASGSTSAGSSKTTTAPASAPWVEQYRGKIVRGFIPEAGYKAVALTFDDGPNQATAKIIKIVASHGGVGTFFFSGKNLQRHGHAKQAKLVENAGFEVANHTQDHTVNDRSALLGRTYAFDVAEITGPDKLIEPVVGHPTLWVRPMGGEIDANGVRAAKDTDHLVLDWTIDSGDSRGWDKTPQYVFDNSTKDVVSGDVILLHATHPESVEALPRICATLTARGFKLVTVSQLAAHSRPLVGARH
jgi:peptidoglycan/xylan/chitin deacetylase (PgdA/CDA1 family)